MYHVAEMSEQVHVSLGLLPLIRTPEKHGLWRYLADRVKMTIDGNVVLAVDCVEPVEDRGTDLPAGCNIIYKYYWSLTSNVQREYSTRHINESTISGNQI